MNSLWREILLWRGSNACQFYCYHIKSPTSLEYPSREKVTSSNFTSSKTLKLIKNLSIHHVVESLTLDSVIKFDFRRSVIRRSNPLSPSPLVIDKNHNFTQNIGLFEAKKYDLFF